MKYNGRDLLSIIDHAAHEALQHQPGHPHVSHNLLLDEMRAARAYGLDTYWKAERPMQALMVAQMWTDTTLDAMRRHDLAKPHGK